MKFYHIALLFFCINVAMSFVNASEIFDTELQPHGEWLGKFTQENIEEQEYSSTGVQSEMNLGLGDYVKAFFYFLFALAAGVVAIPYTLTAFGMPGLYAVIFSIPVYFVYIIGISQFIGNKSLKNME